MSICLIITTAPGRELNLDYCLQQIQRQTLQPQEIIIVDDGSERGHVTARKYNKALPLTYYWKPNTCCVAYSRNRGALLATESLLVFIDSDILLTPRALEAYQDYFKTQPQHILYGYYGTLKHLTTPSLWFPEQWVNWLDERFAFASPETIESPNDIFTAPQQYGWSGNFALLTSTYKKIGGFNEQLIGWGFEDVEFASRAIQQGCQIHFSLDSWGEHMTHGFQERFHKISNQWSIEYGKRLLAKKLKHDINPINYSLSLCDKDVSELSRLIFSYYYPNSSSDSSKNNWTTA